MPNTPALVGEGAAALTRGKNAREEDLNLADLIFGSLGITVVVKEELMDAVTGLSGSGPAYGFVMIEALTDGGVRMGLSRDVALRLAAQTMLGAARLCLQGDWHPAQLKDMVDLSGWDNGCRTEGPGRGQDKGHTYGGGGSGNLAFERIRE